MERDENQRTSCLPKKEQGLLPKWVQCGNKFPRALITWDSKIGTKGRKKEEKKRGGEKQNKANGANAKNREKIGWNAPHQRPTTPRKRIGLRCLPKILRDPQSQLVRPTCRLVCALIFDGNGLGLPKVFRS